MTLRWKHGLSLLCVLALAVSVGAWCPEDEKSGEKAAVAGKSSPCPHSTATLAADDAKSDEAKSPCSGAKASLTAGGEKKGGCAKKCGKSAALTAATEGGDRIEAVLASLPSTKYLVGDEKTCCEKAAAAMAQSSEKPIRYVVGDQTFEKKEDAVVALTAALSAKLEELQSVQYSVNGQCMRCPMSAKGLAKETGARIKYSVGGAEFEEQEKAQTVVKLVADAAKDVLLSYKVGDETFCCDKMAGAKAKKSGAKMTFVVAGEETPCEISAKLLLTQAKIRRVVETALAQQNQKT